MSRKYGHRGYQDNDRDDRERSRPPRQELTKEERIQRRSLRHAIDREANEVIRCHVCGRNVTGLDAIAFDTGCTHCSAALHCCRACKHFDVSSRFQCRTDVTEAIGDKTKANECGKYTPILVLDVTGRRTSGSGGKSNDPRSAFDDLFKR